VTEAGAPRLEPIPPEQWGDDDLAALRSAFSDAVVERFRAPGPDAMPVPNALTTLLHHPKLAGPWLTYNNVLLWDPALDHRLRELIVLRVAWRTRSQYEWVQHVKLGDRYGVTAEDVAAIADGAAASRWSPLERDLLASTDQLLERYRIDDETWSRLAAALDERQLIEVVFVVGTYVCLAMAFKSLGLALDPGLDASAAPALPRDPA
jgi:AhpD family alkylhydroperoxidase